MQTGLGDPVKGVSIITYRDNVATLRRPLTHSKSDRIELPAGNSRILLRAIVNRL